MVEHGRVEGPAVWPWPWNVRSEGCGMSHWPAVTSLCPLGWMITGLSGLHWVRPRHSAVAPPVFIAGLRKRCLRGTIRWLCPVTEGNYLTGQKENVFWPWGVLPPQNVPLELFWAKGSWGTINARGVLWSLLICLKVGQKIPKWKVFSLYQEGRATHLWGWRVDARSHLYKQTFSKYPLSSISSPCIS